MDRNFVKQNIFENQEFPLLDERVRILNEVGNIALQEFEGDFLNIIEKAKHSAVKVNPFLSDTFRCLNIDIYISIFFSIFIILYLLIFLSFL